MKKNTSLILLGILLFGPGNLMSISAQGNSRFPIDPYAVLKTWTYEEVTKNLGVGKEIIDTLYNQAYIAGYRYETEWFNYRGYLEFYFSEKGISRMQFRNERPEKVIPSDLRDLIIRDTIIRNDYNRKEFVADSLRRDSICFEISKILGRPVSSGPTLAGEKNARFQSLWISHGVTCTYKDFVTSSEISFAIAQTPDWAIRDFDLPDNAELIKKERIIMRRSSWTASLLAESAGKAKPGFKRIYLLLEFDSGQRYAEELPSSDSLSAMPDITFDDLNGDAFPDAWIEVPTGLQEKSSKHYIYTLQYKEPLLIFDSSLLLPSQITLQPGYRVEIDFSDGTVLYFSLQVLNGRTDFYNSDGSLRTQATTVPAGFNRLAAATRNKDGCVDLIGYFNIQFPGIAGTLNFAVTYRFQSGGWEPVKSEPAD